MRQILTRKKTKKNFIDPRKEYFAQTLSIPEILFYKQLFQ